MNDKDIKVLGILKKEKSSKPFFVLFVFVLIIGFCFGLPYIKAYLGDDYTLDSLLNKQTSSTSTTTTTTTTSAVVKETVLTCTLSNSEYVYYFSNDKLFMIDHRYSYSNSDEVTNSSILNEFSNRSNRVNSIGGRSEIVSLDDGFVYVAEINSSGDFNLIDPNYYSLDSMFDTIKGDLLQKGFDCK